MKKRTTWILIADGSRARFFVNKGPGEGLEPALGTEFIADKRKSREIGSDRPGRTHDIGGPGRHSMEPPTDPHEYEKIEFARELAQKLEEERTKNTYDQLVVVAPPAMLGHLRANYTSSVRNMIVAELDKDLSKTSIHELPRYLGDVVRL